MKRLLLFFVIGCSATSDGQSVNLDIAYVTGGDASQQMDLYLPAKQNFKTILYIHEGSLVSGDKKDEPYEKIALKFQKIGIGFISMNYRLGPQHKWPAQPEDVCSAFSWIKRNISNYGGDSNKIFIVGHSSGALLTSLVATDEKYLKRQGLQLKNVAGFVCIGTQLKADTPHASKQVILAAFKKDEYLGIFGNLDTFLDANPMNHINGNISPGLFIIAEKEQFQPPILAQTKEFIDRSKPYNLDLKYFVIPGRTHVTNVTKMTEENDPVFELIQDFISRN